MSLRAEPIEGALSLLRGPSLSSAGSARPGRSRKRNGVCRDLRAHATLGDMGPGPSVVRACGVAAATVLAVMVPVLVTGGCGVPAIDRAVLVNDLASRLDHASQLTYTADYQIRGGQTATIAQAQRPFRAAYSFPGGKVVITPEGTLDCRADAGRMTCTRHLPPSPGTAPALGLLTALDSTRNRPADRTGIVPPTLVVGLLTATALDSNAVVSQHDTTIAGEHATCVEVTGVDNAAASAYTACITAGGILGSFEGVVDGVDVEISMTGLRDTVAEDAFDPPAGATVVERR
jgi:hypothetical protein